MKLINIIITSVLTVLMYIISIYLLLVSDKRLDNGLLAISIPVAIIGTWHLLQGGRISDSVLTFTKYSPFGGRMRSNDDPKNLSPIISLGIPIGLLALLIYAFLTIAK